MIDRILKYLYYFLFLVTPLVMFSQTSELFELNKIIVIYAIAALISFFWVTKMILSKKIILKKTPFDIPIIIFLLSQILATVFSIDRYTSFFGYYGRFNGGLLSTIVYIVLYYGFVSNSQNVLNVLKAGLISSVLVALWGLPGKAGHDLTCLIITGKFDTMCWSRGANIFDPSQRMFSLIGQPDWLGAYMAINFFVGLYFYLKSKDKILNFLFYSSILVLEFSSVLFSRSKTALGAMAITLFITGFYFVLTRKFKYYKKQLFLLAFIVVIPILVFKTGVSGIDKYLSISNIKYQISKMSKITETSKKPVANVNITDSFTIRKIVWEGALRLALRYPFFGTGPETFAYSYYNVRPKAHNMTSEWDFIYNKAHNEFLNYLATSGFTGLIAYLIFISVFIVYASKASIIPVIFENFRGTNKSHKAEKINQENNNVNLLAMSLLMAWSTILITNFFGFSTTTTNLYLFLIPAFLLVSNKKEEIVQLGKPNFFQVVGIMVSLSLTAYVLLSLWVFFQADINYSNGLKYSDPRVNDYQQAAYFFQQAIKLRPDPVYEDKFSYSLAYLSVLTANQKNTNSTRELINAAQYYNLDTLKSSPKNVNYWKTRGKNDYLFYVATANGAYLQDGLQAFEEAKALAPTDPKVPYDISYYYSLMYDAAKTKSQKDILANLALKSVDEAINLKPDLYDSYLLKGQLLKKFAKKSEAKKVFEYILTSISPNDKQAEAELKSL